MKKVFLSFFATLALSSGLPGLAAESTSASPKMAAMISRYAKSAACHVFSKDGVKDIGAAYGLIMGMTLIHELGHAFAAKMLNGSPVDVVLGGSRGKAPFMEIGGVKFSGFNPLQSEARWEERYSADGMIYQPTVTQDTAMLLAGPIAQAATCFCAYQLLKKSDKFYITKATALGGMADTIIGINGICGALFVPWSDASKIVGNIKKLCAGH